MSDTTLAALQRHLDVDIPLARAIGVQVEGLADGALTLSAPLAPNVNDKGCAFGGSLASVMTLAGWGLLTLSLGEADADVYVQDSRIRYLAPVWTDFRAVARLAPGHGIRALLDDLARHGRARTETFCDLLAGDSGEPAATLEARYVAIARSPAGAARVPD